MKIIKLFFVCLMLIKIFRRRRCRLFLAFVGVTVKVKNMLAISNAVVVRPRQRPKPVNCRHPKIQMFLPLGNFLMSRLISFTNL